MKKLPDALIAKKNKQINGSLSNGYSILERPLVLLANKIGRRSFLHKMGIGAVIATGAGLEGLSEIEQASAATNQYCRCSAGGLGSAQNYKYYYWAGCTSSCTCTFATGKAPKTI